MIISITASLSSKMYSIAPNRKKLRVRRHTINFVQIKLVVLGGNLGFVLGVLV